MLFRFDRLSFKGLAQIADVPACMCAEATWFWDFFTAKPRPYCWHFAAKKTCDSLDADVCGIWQLIEIGKIGMEHVYPRWFSVVYDETNFALTEIRIQGEIRRVKHALNYTVIWVMTVCIARCFTHARCKAVPVVRGFCF